MGFLEKLRGKIKTARGLISGLSSRERFRDNPKILYAGFGFLLFLFLLGLVVVLWTGNRSRKAEQAAAEALAGAFADLSIPPEELFWPDEPDFVPPVQLNRLPRGRAENTEKDIPYWVDPGEEYADRWRERIGSAVDELMEKVP
jgi:hypothetical protein